MEAQDTNLKVTSEGGPNPTRTRFSGIASPSAHLCGLLVMLGSCHDLPSIHSHLEATNQERVICCQDKAFPSPTLIQAAPKQLQGRPMPSI